MKKLLAITTLLVYFAVSTGFVVSMHYCMDEFDTAQIGTTGEEKCGKCGMHKKDGCCREEVTIVKLQTIHMAAGQVQPQLIIPVVALPYNEFHLTPVENFISVAGTIAHGPPLLSGQEIHIKNRVFRI